MRIRALDRKASEIGLYAGQALADARAIEPRLIAFQDEPKAEARRFRQFAQAQMRFSPIVSAQQTAELFIDITGCQRLFGGEEVILNGFTRRAEAAGFSVQATIADTAGSAWALARYGEKKIIAPRAHKVAIAGLPVEALRLPSELSDRLRRLGLKTIGQLYDMPRAPLAARFTKILLSRLGQALGNEAEPLVPLIPTPRYYTEHKLAEPISTIDAVKLILQHLAGPLTEQLAAKHIGARCFELLLFRVDNQMMRVRVNASSPARDTNHLMRLFSNKLDDFAKGYDAGFGIELLRLCAFDVQPLSVQQKTAFGVGTDKAEQEERLISFKDRISNRLGAGNVCYLGLRDTHLPERAACFVPVMNGEPKKRALFPNTPRPLKILSHPEEISVMAEIPDAPPIRFQWRSISYAVARASGPERIADEWYRRGDAGLTRDYYRVETREGYRYWIFRDGLYGAETQSPRWFMHGVFS